MREWLSAVGAHLFYLVAQVLNVAPGGLAIGASGAVPATLILFAFHFPRAQVRLYFFIPMPVWLLAVLYVGFDALGAMGDAGDPRGGRIAHFAHLGGAACGLIYFQSGVRLTRVFDRAGRTHVRPKLRVVPAPDEDQDQAPVAAAVATAHLPLASAPSDEQLEAKLDAVLEKVSEHGPNSLTPEEREIFYKAGELYKKRRQ